MNRNSKTNTFNLITGILALGILTVVVLITRDRFFQKPVKETALAPSSTQDLVKTGSENKTALLKDPGTDVYVFSRLRFETKSFDNGTDPIAAQLNREGITYYTQGDFIQAVEVFKQAYERDTRNTTIQHNLAHAKGSLGWNLFDNRRYNDALLNFQEALQLKKQEPFLWLGQGMAYLRLSDNIRAIRSLKKTIELDPSIPDPYKVLGNIYYNQDEIEMAVGYFELALELDPGDKNLKTQLAKAQREETTEYGFQRSATRFFTIKYEGRENGDITRRVLDNLDSAYSEIGKMLSYYPEVSITVILYTEKQFKDVTQTPSWISGLFDGKIRIPVSGADENPALLRQVLYHEYSHALLFQLTRGAPIPRWFDEGLAEFFEDEDPERKNKAFLLRIRNGQKPLPLSALHGSFMGLPSGQAGLVYSESFSAVYSLIDRYGIYRLRLLLDDLAEGKSFETAFFDQFMIPYNQFQKEWEEQVYEAAL